jgi:hypothetical protein
MFSVKWVAKVFFFIEYQNFLTQLIYPESFHSSEIAGAKVDVYLQKTKMLCILLKK